MRAALSYDDGPSEWTAPLLDLLAEHGAHATFFALGAHVAGREETLQRAHADGHEVGVHGHSHKRLTSLDDAEVRQELSRCATLLREATGVVPTLWRAPHFASDSRVNAIAASLGLRHIAASLDPGDWARTSAEGIADAVQRGLRHGDVICLHDGVPPGGGTGTSSRRPTLDATRMLLEREPSVDWVGVSDL